MKRRTWILSALGATGALVVGWGVMPARSRLGKPDNMLATQNDVALNGWIKIAQDGTVVLAMPRSEMGQGVHTALAMLVAEELDVPLQRVRLEQAGADSIYGNVAMLVASVVAGWLWETQGASFTFVGGGVFAVLALLVLGLRPQPPTESSA